MGKSFTSAVYSLFREMKWEKKKIVLVGAVAGEVVSKAENELLSRAYIHMFLGDDALDKDAREKFGTYLLSLF